MTRYATIIATGSYLPPIEVSNETLRASLAHVPDYVDKMEAATGILKRWYAPDDWSTSDLALPAARQALERASKKPDDVDLIILGTDSPDFITPATSVVVQEKLGAKNAGTFDVGCACASFPTGPCGGGGLDRDECLPEHRAGYRRLPDAPARRSQGSRNLFLWRRSERRRPRASRPPGFMSSAMLADGSYNHYWGIFAGGTAEPASEIALREGRTRVQIVKRYPPEINEQGWPRLVQQLARNGGFALQDVDLFIFTQVRKPTIEHVMTGLGLSMERAHTIMEDHGYTGSACVGMTLHDAIVKGKLRAGGLVVMVGSGVGYNQAGVAFRMP